MRQVAEAVLSEPRLQAALRLRGPHKTAGARDDEALEDGGGGRDAGPSDSAAWAQLLQALSHTEAVQQPRDASEQAPGRTGQRLRWEAGGMRRALGGGADGEELRVRRALRAWRSSRRCSRHLRGGTMPGRL